MWPRSQRRRGYAGLESAAELRPLGLKPVNGVETCKSPGNVKPRRRRTIDDNEGWGARLAHTHVLFLTTLSPPLDFTMPMLLEGSCHCRAIKYTVESNTPVPYQLCQCSICRKTGGYTGSVNIMGNNPTLKVIRGKDKMKEYTPAMAFDKNDHPTRKTTSIRTFCGDCSAMLWNWHPEWPDWIYPLASSIDSDLPTFPKGVDGIAIKRDSCPAYVPIPAGFKSYEGYGPGAGIETK
ncbi:uncharacterized protein EHS24_008600 [Apiotrichum porosum]|uniref:CENP-V/GFA domain-containing protein n=1 Tax=Apiotrichum porosum TaxID=105984 RepID=A0A427XQS5_9TREE|nr:uncharacterized protein EHS24_008600 [Apiotrichum porosum]RSH81163.1 hypothetical protein EHS24_008600 [Apiotrichum porosum]